MAVMTVEFLLASVLVAALIGALASSMLAEVLAVRDKADEYVAINHVADVVCALEAAFNSGAEADAGFGRGQQGWRIERGVLHAYYEGRVVEVRGVFSDDRTEPI
jgi:hypothetical protein